MFSCDIPSKDFLEPREYYILDSKFLLGSWVVEETTLDSLIPENRIKMMVFQEDNLCEINDNIYHYEIRKDLINKDPLLYSGPRLYLTHQKSNKNRIYNIISNTKLLSTKNNSIINLIP